MTFEQYQAVLEQIRRRQGTDRPLVQVVAGATIVRGRVAPAPRDAATPARPTPSSCSSNRDSPAYLHHSCRSPASPTMGSPGSSRRDRASGPPAQEVLVDLEAEGELGEGRMQRRIHHPRFGQAGEGVEESVLDLPEVRLESQEGGRGEELLGARRDGGEIGVGVEVFEGLQQRFRQRSSRGCLAPAGSPRLALARRAARWRRARRPRRGPAGRSRRGATMSRTVEAAAWSGLGMG